VTPARGPEKDCLVSRTNARSRLALCRETWFQALAIRAAFQGFSFRFNHIRQDRTKSFRKREHRKTLVFGSPSPAQSIDRSRDQAYDVADTPPSQGIRIQNLKFKTFDTLLLEGKETYGTRSDYTIVGLGGRGADTFVFRGGSFRFWLDRVVDVASYR
jgi:hypothetical protein